MAGARAEAGRCTAVRGSCRLALDESRLYGKPHRFRARRGAPKLVVPSLRGRLSANTNSQDVQFLNRYVCRLQETMLRNKKRRLRNLKSHSGRLLHAAERDYVTRSKTSASRRPIKTLETRSRPDLRRCQCARFPIRVQIAVLGALDEAKLCDPLGGLATFDSAVVKGRRRDRIGLGRPRRPMSRIARAYTSSSPNGLGFRVPRG
jgi:hypothetical protein